MILSQRHSLGCIVLFLTAAYCFTAISNAAVWISGSNTVDQAGIYGMKGAPASTNIIGARDGSISWTDADGNLWLFGGYYYNEIYGRTASLFNDLWKFDCSTGWWV